LKSNFIPASVEVLSKYFFTGSTVETVTFEANSRLRQIESGAFCECVSLKSICIPSSVEELTAKCFSGSSIETLSFDCNSKLRRIEKRTFSGCSSLKSIYFPASLEHIDVSALVHTTVSMIDFAEGNMHFRVVGRQLLNYSGTSLLRFIGTHTEVKIDRSIEQLCAECFRQCKSLEVVRFASESSLIRIDESAFHGCSSLKSISIPHSVETLCQCCFSHCISLASVIFEPGSKIRSIPASAFSNCSSLRSIVIPRSVESLGSRCFSYCTSLKTVTVENESRLTKIEKDAFLGCRSLESFDIPAAANVTWEILSARLRGKGVSVNSWSHRKPRISSNQPPDYIRFPKDHTISLPSSPRQRFSSAMFSDSGNECLRDEFEIGYHQFLSMIDPSFT
jgi:hypothetical protein